MKPIRSLLQSARGLGLVSLALCCWCPGLAVAVTFSVSPSSVGHREAGVITFQVGGLLSGEQVIIARYLAGNGNGVLDSSAWLLMAKGLTDNKAPSVIAGVTNVNVPYDLDPMPGSITAQVDLRMTGLAQRWIGSGGFVLSSPTSRFTPITNLFTITNSAYAQTVSGTVLSGGAAVPGALVVLTRLPSSSKGFNGEVGIMADAAGHFSLQAAPGTYAVSALKQGFVSEITASPVITLNSGGTATAQPLVVAATRTISGQMVDADTPTKGIPAVLFGGQSKNGFFAIGATDINGDFTMAVTPDQWGGGQDSQTLSYRGYVDLNNGFQADTTSGNVTGILRAFPKATACFYGSVQDDQRHPLAGVRLGADNGQNGNGDYQGDGTTDQNGNYVIGVVAGLWSPGVSGKENHFNFGGYIFSQSAFSFDHGGSGANLTAGSAVRQDFTALPAPYHITGSLKDGGNNQPIANKVVYAYATLNGIDYNAPDAATDQNGNYSINVANGGWHVGVSCGDSSDSLPSTYQCPNQIQVNIVNADGVANFVVQSAPYLITGRLTDPNNNGIGNVNIYAYTSGGGNSANDTTDGNGNYSLNVGNGTWNVGVSCGNGGNGSLDTQGYQCVNEQVVTVSNGNRQVNFTAQHCPQLQVTSNSLHDGTRGSDYGCEQLQADGCHQPFTWSLAPGSGPLPTGLNLSSDGNLCGTPSATGTFNFVVRVTDGNSATADQALWLRVNDNTTPLQIVTTGLPTGQQNVAYSTGLNATGGQTPYQWSLTPGSASLPSGLSLNSSGLISGTPSTNGTFYFFVRVTDANSTTVDQLLGLAITAPAPPPLHIDTTTLPVAIVGTPYAAQVMASGGQQPYSWSLALGSANLPAGLSLDLNGNISGTPTASGTFIFIVRVNDATFASLNQVLTLTVQNSGGSLRITPPVLNGNSLSFTWNATPNRTYQVQFKTDLNQANWALLTSVTPTGSTGSASDSLPANTTKFYRVVQMP